MFKVFDDSDLDIWRNWVFSLKNGLPQNNLNPDMDSFTAMFHLVSRVGLVASAVPRHHVIQVWGPSPNNGELIRQSVGVWLNVSIRDPITMLKVLIEPQNRLVTCGDANTSTFLTTLLQPSGEMGKMYSRYAADVLVGDSRHHSTLWTWTDIIRRWIEDDCPLESNGGFNLFPEPPAEGTFESLPFGHSKKQLPGGVSSAKAKYANVVQQPTGSGQYWVH